MVGLLFIIGTDLNSTSAFKSSVIHLLPSHVASHRAWNELTTVCG